MQITPTAEVELHGFAADMQWSLKFRSKNNWLMQITYTVTGKTRLQQLTDEQASATVALFIGELEMKPSLNEQLYDIAEQVWASCPLEFRPIP